jgi:hypothetical protein
MEQNTLSGYLELDGAFRTAGCGPACPVVWGGGAKHSPLPDFGLYFFYEFFDFGINRKSCDNNSKGY